MIDLKDLKKRPEFYKTELGKRSSDFTKIVGDLINLLNDLKDKPNELEILQAEINKLNRMIPTLQGSGKEKILKSVKKLSVTRDKKKIEVEVTELKIKDLATNLPNLPLEDVPNGKDSSGNKVLREVGDREKLKSPKNYFTLAANLDIIDVERAVKISGSRFGYLKGAGALLEFALIQYAMSILTKAGFTAIVPPVIINEPYMAAMGYLAQGGTEEIYHLDKDKQFLVGTSEQSVGPYHADEIIPITELPKKYAAFSTCFRREAGSYGKDTKGILRVHQFDKVEMFVVCTPEESEKIHQELLSLQEKLVQGLGIPYRVMLLCAGDIGFPSAKTYDIECWLPGQNNGKGEYRETHSTSNTTDYQARALNIRVKGTDGKNRIAHMLNGTAFAIGRTIIAILENYQNPDGTIRIPEVLQPFMHGLKQISK